MAFPPSPKGLFLLCFLSQLHLTLGALYKVADVNGKWALENYLQTGDSLCNEATKRLVEEPYTVKWFVVAFSHHTESGEVHEVSRMEYKACHTSNPMKTYKRGSNVAELGWRKSTYYFISGDKALCESGRKLMVVVVLASSPGPAASPSTASVAAPPPSGEAKTPAPASTTAAGRPAPAGTTVPTPAPTTAVGSAPAPTAHAASPTTTVGSSPSSRSQAGPAPAPSAPAPASSTSPPSPPFAPTPTPSTPPPPPSAAPPLPILLMWSMITAIALSSSLITLLA